MTINIYNYEREQRQFKENILAKLPKNWLNTANLKWEELAKQSIKTANTYLLDLNDAIEGAIEIGASDNDLINLAVDLVSKVRVMCSEQTTRAGKSQAFNLHECLEALCIEYGVRYPIEHARAQIIARLTDSAFWLRGLRASLAKRAEGAAIDAGMVSKRAEVYCSDDTLARRCSQHGRNAETLSNIEMMNKDTGEIMKLSDIAKAGMADHENRRAELVTRVRGFEELARKYKHKAEFITVTCPSRMHAVTSDGKQNPKYDKTKPDAAQKFLVQAWARTRAQFAKNNIKVYGLRIAEPHHDATPHWHLILFYRDDKNTKFAIRKHFREQFVLGDEAFDNYEAKGKAERIKNGLKFVSINPRKGSAAGYVLKYVLKNIGGIEKSASDEAEHLTSEGLYPRVEAWAACWRIRQFQQIGGHYVSVWRELRRVDECKLEGLRPAFVKTWKACQKQGEQKADWAAYIEGMGGLEVKPRESVLKVDYDLIMGMGRYGETVLKRVLGVGERFGKQVAGTSRAEWVAL
jgi:hypothetical protein